MRTWPIIGVVVALFAAREAHAQSAEGAPTHDGFGRRGSTVISIEDVFGTVTLRESTGSAAQISTTNWFLWPFATHFGLSSIASNGVSVTGLVSGGYLSNIGGGGAGDDHLFSLDLRFRVGYAAPVSPYWGVWVRGGLNYLHAGVSRGDNSDAVGAGIDGYLVVTPVPHFGVLGGFNYDVSIAGSKRGDGHDALAFAPAISLGLLWDFR